MYKTFLIKKNTKLFTIITIFLIMVLSPFLYGEETITVEKEEAQTFLNKWFIKIKNGDSVKSRIRRLIHTTTATVVGYISN